MSNLGLAEAYTQVFEEMGLTGDSGAPLKIRTLLLLEIKKIIEKKGWTQAEAADALKVKQPRISEIMTLRIDKFSVELLIKYLDRLDKQISFKIKRK